MTRPRLAVLALVVVTLAGCGTTTTTQVPVSTGGTRAPASTTSETTQAPVSPTSSTAATMPPELTAEEALRNNPPPPRDVRAQVVQGAVEVTWGNPPAVTVPHAYSDRVVAYRVYRRGPGETELKPIGSASTHRYVDSSARGGSSYEYAVTSVREHQVEGPRSDAVLVTVR